MGWILVIVLCLSIGSAAIPIALLYLLIKALRKRHSLPGKVKEKGPKRVSGQVQTPVSPSAPKGCPHAEASQLGKMQRRLSEVYRQFHEALDRRIHSEMARSRVAPPLEDAYQQIANQISSIYAFCERNDLTGTLQKARTSTTAKDIYQDAYDRDLAKVRAAIDKTEECLTAYERTVATLEVSSVDSDITSDFDASIEMLRSLRKELPLYSLEDQV